MTAAPAPGTTTAPTPSSPSCSRNLTRSGECEGKYLLTLLIQGGEYEFAPFIRGKERGEENFEEVARLFDGSYENKIVKDAEAGTLNLFNGMRSLHRVRTVSASYSAS